MTGSEISDEWNHVYQTRIAILCGTGEPTREYQEMAWQEADEAVERMKAEFKEN